MKTTSPSVRFFQPAVAAALAIVIAWGLSVQPAQANPYVVTLQQVGPDVVATASGALDLTGLSGPDSEFGGRGPVIGPSLASISTGATGGVFFEVFTGFSTISGPTSFGSGGGMPTNSGTGDFVGINGV